MHDIHPVALFRYSVLGPLVSRAQLQRGELKATLRELAERHYDIPGSGSSRLSEKTIEAWYYTWLRGGIEALEPKARFGPGTIEDRPPDPGGDPGDQARESAPFHRPDLPPARAPWQGG